MKIIPLFLLLLVCSLFCLAQATVPHFTVKGNIVDSVSRKPLPFVTVALIDDKTRMPLKSLVSSEDGSFSINGKSENPCSVLLAFAGYSDKSIPLPAGRSEIDLGLITLSTANKLLKEVTVSAVRPVLKRDLDGITYDVGADPESPALTALDIMRKVPLLTVDASDNIKLKGSGNYKILINGKESALVAKNPSDVLRAMPATNIEKIEVITTPPAKYDAEGLAGIINIITKKNVGEGYNIGVNARYNSIWGPGINLNGTFKKGKFGLSGYAGYNQFSSQNTPFNYQQNFLADNSMLEQNGRNSFGGRRNYMDLELSYELDSLNLLTASMELFHGRNDQSNHEVSTLLSSDGIVNQNYQLNSSGLNTWQGMDIAFNYQKGFRRDKNQLLTLSYKYNYSPYTLANTNLFSDTLNFQTPNYQQNNNAGNKENTLQLDYVHPVKKLAIEAGAKAIFRNNYSNFQMNNYDDTLGKYVPNPSQTDNFKYRQNILSVYNSYQYKIDKWTAKAGLRIENTSVDANFEAVNTPVTQDYNNFVPSVSIQRSFTGSSLTFGYTDRISRPGIFQLNPFVDQSNPKFISTGNPDLKPETNHTFELSYSKFSKNNITIGLNYAFSKNAIQNINYLQINTVPAGGIDTVTVSTYSNLGSNNQLGINFNLNLSLIKDLSISLNGQAAHVWLAGTYNGVLYHNDGFTGNAFLNAGYKFGKVYRIGLDAGLFSGDVNLQGKSSGFIFSSYVFSRTFLQKKLTVSAVANNPYEKYFKKTTKNATADYYQTNYDYEIYRTFAIRVNYKFGKLSTDIKRNQRGINNDDTKGGKSGGSSQ